MRVVAALSGGVDSAVAAARLVREGADVVGVHLRTGVEAEDPAGPHARRSCCGVDDSRDARAVAARLGIPFYVVDVSEPFARDVIGGFVEAYAAGRTPNPCVVCNRSIKFGRLLEVAASLSSEAVATGHYARTAPRDGGGVRLLRGADPGKDQSYVLFALSQAQLAAARFPLGASRKEQVRDEARALGLPVAEKPDSQELCFVPGGDHRAVLEAKAPHLFRDGPIEDATGVVVGSHRGAAGFTPGQRRGLRVAAREPLYVTAVDTAANRVVVGSRADLLRRTVVVDDVNWVDVAPPRSPPEAASLGAIVEARIRHGQPPGRASVEVDETAARVVVRFEAPVFAPAPGQALVAYRGEAVLFGGTIVESAA